MFSLLFAQKVVISLPNSFHPLFKIYYSLVIKVSTFVLLKFRKNSIDSILLMRGYCNENFIPGVSDIDIFILIKEGQGKAGILFILKSLKRLFLLIDVHAHSVMSLSEFTHLMNESSFYSFRFNQLQEDQDYQILYGKDFLAKYRFSECSGFTDLGMISEGKYWISYFLAEIWQSTELIEHRKNIVYFKSVAELGKIYLFLKYQKKAKSRIQALKLLNEVNFKPDSVSNLIALYHNKFAGKYIEASLVWELLVELQQIIILEIKRKSIWKKEISLEYHPLPEREDIHDIVTSVINIIGPCTYSMSKNFELELSMDILIIKPEEKIRTQLTTWKSLNTLSRELIKKNIVLYIDYENFILGTNKIEMDYCHKTIVTELEHPESWALVNNRKIGYLTDSYKEYMRNVYYEVERVLNDERLNLLKRDILNDVLKKVRLIIKLILICGDREEPYLELASYYNDDSPEFNLESLEKLREKWKDLKEMSPSL